MHFIFFEQAIRLKLPANESGNARLGSIAPAQNQIAHENMPVGTGKFHSASARRTLNEVPPGQRV
ncbi:MAG: hypothetical protein DME18_04160 [Verrucomicrobia bacterium]|nr:MAG: hypothetical protein DME18_04160 [Verrucomicrobiota bacterium]